MNHYDFGRTSKVTKDVAYLYQSIYEGKERVDQDEDGDNDFADIRIARMIASGVPKEEAIRRVRDKSYNEETELDESAKRTPKKQRGSKNEEEYMAGRSDAGKRISGNQRVGPAYYTLGRSRGAGPDAPTRPGNRPKNTPKVTKGELDYARKRNKDVSGKDWNRFGGPKGLPEEFEVWVQDLLDEGYDLTDYTLDEIYEIFEETIQEKEAKAARIAARRARVKEMTARGEVMTPERRTRERAKQRRQEEQEEKIDRVLRQVRGETGRKVSQNPMGSEAPAPKEAAPEATRRLKTGLKRDTLGKAADDILKSIRNEEYEMYSCIVEHLIENGYAEDIDSANTMIMHMSEEWVESIIESL